MENKTESQDDAPFNMAMLYYVRLSKLMDKKDGYAMEGNIPGWFTGLRAIYRNIFFKLSDNDKNKLRVLFEDARNYLLDSGGSGRVAMQVHGFNMSRASEKLDEIDCEIMDILSKNKMIFPAVEINKGLRSLRDKYNLDGKQ